MKSITNPVKIFIVLIATLSGCATSIMESYVGGSITNPMLDYGRPTDVFEISEGKRAFQWVLNSTGVVPVNNPSRSTIYGSGGWASITTNTTSYRTYSKQCRYTLTATWNGDDWIVDGFRPPSFRCL